MSDEGSDSAPVVVVKPKMLKKQKYFASLQSALEEFEQAFIVNADNVGSKQIQQIRAATRKNSLIVFGKNTQMKKAIRQKINENPDLEKLIPHLVGNVGLVFTKGDLVEVRDTISANKVPAPARSGAIAQCAVTIPAGLTGMEPTQTQFFQALNIPTKINKGQIEIISDVQLFKAGDKFIQVYDKGAVYSPDVLNVTDEQLLATFKQGVGCMAALSLAIGHPTQASVAHSVMNGLKNLVAISLVTDYVIGPAEKIKAILDDPEALAAMAAAAAAAPASGGAEASAAAAEAAPAEEEEEEEEEEPDFDLFD